MGIWIVEVVHLDLVVVEHVIPWVAVVVLLYAVVAVLLGVVVHVLVAVLGLWRTMSTDVELWVLAAETVNKTKFTS